LAASASTSTTTNGLSRAVLYPTFMLAGGTLLPNIGPAVCQVYNDWVLNDYCAGSRRSSDPGRDLADDGGRCGRCRDPRVAAAGFPAVFIRTNPVQGKKYSDRSFDPLWQAIVDTGLKLGLQPTADVGPGTARPRATSSATSWRRRASASRWT